MKFVNEEEKLLVKMENIG